MDNIRIVLVETSHSGNMGSTARAMKTMGLNHLYLVKPLVKPNSQAIALSAGASDIIGNATIVDTFEQGISGCRLVMGTSARTRSSPWPVLDPREGGQRCVLEAQQAPVAIVFGRERIGLTNEELQKCHYHVVIPANPEYSALNLAMAVQIICYEIRVAYLAAFSRGAPCASEDMIYPLFDDLERFYLHLEQTLQQTGFIRPQHPGQIMSRLRGLFTRARLNTQELNILRGILASIKKWP